MTKDINEHIDKINKSLDGILDETEDILKPVTNHLKKAKGKNIRSRLMIAIALDLNEEITENLINKCVAIELMHLSTLIHDDIIDESPIRRGIESVQNKFGNKLAVITGDYLYTKCFYLISKYAKEDLENFAKVIELICLGEVYQLKNNRNFDITVKEYLKIISGKTSVMFGLAMYSVSDDKEKREILSKAGHHFGTMFQLTDDYLDYKGTFKQMKKETFKDLNDGVITYPVIITLNRNKDLKEKIKVDFTQKNIQLVINSIIKNKSLEETKNKIKEYYNFTKDKLSEVISVENSCTIKIIDLVYNKNYE